ncbi:lipid-A-disaccharide synthase [Pedobacter sp. BS3]|uniref:lipid-A-disaccharide synthase n=1 Tax=Pedobacter sp. BS3 TaxID=2567937 RepID=UPI0011EFB904|nr:lipid-A-disaccharide synthase [Pedobacter sp. BS3]TZF84110.1 lipid-A-disaccharide synthase [Pedobacter sp. BS3]
MKYYLIAGEASGDLHGANLMKALKKHDENAAFRFFGGDLMQAEGGKKAVKHISELSYMGFVEVAVNLRAILNNISLAKRDILNYRPDALILIDFPGFNLKIAEYAKKNGIKVFYYISPKVWAWNQKRVLRIKRSVDHLFCILPFEVNFYRKWGMEVDYVGNPLLDAIAAHKPDLNFREHYQLSGKPIIALLPGSRKQEISKILPEMIGIKTAFPGYQLVIAGAPNFDQAYYDAYTHGEIPVVFNATYDLLSNAYMAVVTSGTATLETALFNVPQVVVYKANPLTIFIARLVIKIRYISLVNLIADQEIVKELIQNECNSEKIILELNKISENAFFRGDILKKYAILKNKMGDIGASDKTSLLILEYLSK